VRDTGGLGIVCRAGPKIIESATWLTYIIQDPMDSLEVKVPRDPQRPKRCRSRHHRDLRRGVGCQGYVNHPKIKDQPHLDSPQTTSHPHLLMGVTLKKYVIMEVGNVGLKLVSKANSAAQCAGHFVSRRGWMSKGEFH